MKIYMELPWAPLSSNHMYMTIRKGRKMLRVLTKEGRKFKKEATAYLAKKYPMELAQMKKDQPYSLFLRIYLPDIENKTWPESAENRYKKLDALNRTKALEDVLADVSAVDDSHFMIAGVEKRQGPEASEVFIWPLEESPFHALSLKL